MVNRTIRIFRDGLIVKNDRKYKKGFAALFCCRINEYPSAARFGLGGIGYGWFRGDRHGSRRIGWRGCRFRRRFGADRFLLGIHLIGGGVQQFLTSQGLAFIVLLI